LLLKRLGDRVKAICSTVRYFTLEKRKVQSPALAIYFLPNPVS
jgi:hypothetical protein